MGQAEELQRGIAKLARANPPHSALRVPGQPFDARLLELSPLYRKSRKLFLETGGTFEPALLSSPRTLSSTALLKNRVEYSPSESELVWSATDPAQKRNPSRLLELRAFSACLYHEQNHRIFWNTLPAAPREPGALRRYLNFAEALVVTLDMALGDELGPQASRAFYLAGVAYDPGTRARTEIRARRNYRNYLQAALHATYLRLEMYRPADIRAGIPKMYHGLGSWAARAAERSLRLDDAFVRKTNPLWQMRNRRAVIAALGGPKPLVLPDDGADNRAQYLFAEAAFDRFGL